MKSGYISLLPTVPAPPSLRLMIGTRAGICNRRAGLPELSWPKNTIPAARNAWRTASSFSGEGRRPPRSNSRISTSLKSHLAPRLTRDQFNRARAAVTCSGVKRATKHLHCFLILPRIENSRTCSIAGKKRERHVALGPLPPWNNDVGASFDGNETASLRFRGNSAAGLLDRPRTSRHPLWSGRIFPY